MGEVRVAIGGRTYPLACGDGEEAHIAALAAQLASKADELTAAIGAMSEPRLLLMAGLQVADELFALKSEPAPTPAAANPAADDDARYAAALARIEALAATLAG